MSLRLGITPGLCLLPYIKGARIVPALDSIEAYGFSLLLLHIVCPDFGIDPRQGTFNETIAGSVLLQSSHNLQRKLALVIASLSI